MCPPAVIAAVGAGVAAAGSIVGGVMAKQQANFQAKMAERNASIERENIALEQEATRREALNHYRKVAQLKGQQRAAAAANGVSTDFGTAQDIVMDTNMMAREDAANIYGQGDQNVLGRDRAVANFKGQASAARAQGRNAMISAAFDATGSLLGGAQQYRKLKLASD